MEGTELVAIAVGGALGGALRYWVTLLTTRVAGQWLPWGTLAVNCLGSLLIGLFAGLLGTGATDSNAGLFLIVGFCGSLTTVSSWALQSLELYERQRPVALALNLVLTLVLGFAAALSGLWVSGGWS